MSVSKLAATVAVLAMPTLFAASPASAFTARQYTFQGQGVFLTSKGLPLNYVVGDAPQSQAYLAERAGKPEIKDFEHHGRYVGGE